MSNSRLRVRLDLEEWRIRFRAYEIISTSIYYFVELSSEHPAHFEIIRDKDILIRFNGDSCSNRNQSPSNRGKFAWSDLPYKSLVLFYNLEIISVKLRNHGLNPRPPFWLFSWKTLFSTLHATLIIMSRNNLHCYDIRPSIFQTGAIRFLP